MLTFSRMRLRSKDLSDGRFAAGIDIGGVEVVDAGSVGGHKLALGLIQVDVVAFSGKTHAAEAQDGQLVSGLRSLL